MSEIAIIVDSLHSLTTFTVRGKLTADQILQAVRDFYEGSPTKNVLWDLTGAETLNITPGDIEQIILIARQYPEKRDKEGKTAIVAQKDLDFGLGRMYESFTEISDLPYGYKIFRDLPKALEWLAPE